MRGSRIPSPKRIINSVSPLNPSDLSEANALNLMFLYDNIGTGEYLEDASIIGRHLKQLFAREQATPNMTLEVLAGIAWYSQNANVNFAGGNSPAFVAPATNPRIDILVLRSDGILYVIQGSEAASPTAPTITSTDIPIAQVYNRVGETVIHDNDSQVAGQGYIQYDLRPFIQVAVGSSAMPKIGLVTRVKTQSTTNVFEDVVNFSGAGRLRSVAAVLGGGNPGAARGLKITIDGIVFLNDSTTIIGAAVNAYLVPTATDSATNLVLATGGPQNPAVNLNIYFKQSLHIEQRGISGGIDYMTTTVEYEHE